MSIDDLIIKKAAAGDKEAFRLIVEQYQNLVIAACINILRDFQEAENIAQETFLQVYRSLPQYRYEGFKTWIMRIAVNKALDYKRKKVRRKENEIISIDSVSFIEDGSLKVDDILIKDEKRQELLEKCNKLPSKYSSVIHKYYYLNKSRSEIAAEENISEKTVDTRLYRGRKLLKDMIKEVL